MGDVVFWQGEPFLPGSLLPLSSTCRVGRRQLPSSQHRSPREAEVRRESTRTAPSLLREDSVRGLDFSAKSTLNWLWTWSKSNVFPSMLSVFEIITALKFQACLFHASWNSCSIAHKPRSFQMTCSPAYSSHVVLLPSDIKPLQAGTSSRGMASLAAELSSNTVGPSAFCFGDSKLPLGVTVLSLLAFLLCRQGSHYRRRPAPRQLKQNTSMKGPGVEFR